MLIGLHLHNPHAEKQQCKWDWLATRLGEFPHACKSLPYSAVTNLVQKAFASLFMADRQSWAYKLIKTVLVQLQHHYPAFLPGF